MHRGGRFTALKKKKAHVAKKKKKKEEEEVQLGSLVFHKPLKIGHSQLFFSPRDGYK